MSYQDHFASTTLQVALTPPQRTLDDDLWVHIWASLRAARAISAASLEDLRIEVTDRLDRALRVRLDPTGAYHAAPGAPKSMFGVRVSVVEHLDENPGYQIVVTR